MKHFLYIIHSESIDKFYIGESPNPVIRLELHNNHHFNKSFTNAASDWRIKLTYSCISIEDAKYLERFLKRMKNRKFIIKVIENPSILDDIISKKQ